MYATLSSVSVAWFSVRIRPRVLRCNVHGIVFQYMRRWYDVCVNPERYISIWVCTWSTQRFALYLKKVFSRSFTNICECKFVPIFFLSTMQPQFSKISLTAWSISGRFPCWYVTVLPSNNCVHRILLGYPNLVIDQYVVNACLSCVRFLESAQSRCVERSKE